jgi:CubicO group peptidase (beta-lactamase class C family)
VRRLPLLVLFAVLLLAIFTVVYTTAFTDRARTTTWSQRGPEEAGLSPDSLKALVASVADDDSRGVVIKDGHLIFAWGSHWVPADWGSATKPFVSLLIMFALSEGRLASVDQPIGGMFEGLRSEDQNITFRHLANMTSGYSLPEGPGESWEYNDYAIKLYFLAFFDRLLHLSLEDATDAERFVSDAKRLGPLEFEDGNIFLIKSGVPRLYMSPRDYARVGWLLCTKGRWNGHQLLPRRYFDEYLKPDVPPNLPRSKGGSVEDYLGIGTAGGENSRPNLRVGPGAYGFNWWFNAGRMLWPDLPPDTFQANGHWNSNTLTVIPSLGLVVAWVDGKKVKATQKNFGERFNDALGPFVREVMRTGRIEPCG